MSTPPNLRPVREEDAFDVAGLAAWLAGHVADPQVAALLEGQPQVGQFAGGASNLTYLLTYPDLELVLRRPPAGAKPASGHDMVREHTIQSRLGAHYPHVPQMVALCTDHTVLGSDFYVMRKVPGQVVRGGALAGLGLDRAGTRALCGQFVDMFADLHAVDVDAAGLAQFSRGGGYVRRQVEGWTKRFAKAKTPNVLPFTRVTDWLAANQPADSAAVLIHGDYRLDNLVVDDQARPRAVLDWELATVGDPLMDLGASVAYWVQADDDRLARATKRQPSDAPGMLTRRELIERYLDRSGRTVQVWGFYEVFGLFRLAVIAQQIYYRYHHKQTSNPEFKNFWIMVNYLNLRCRRMIGRIEKGNTWGH